MRKGDITPPDCWKCKQPMVDASYLMVGRDWQCIKCGAGYNEKWGFWSEFDTVYAPGKGTIHKRNLSAHGGGMFER